MGALCDRLRTLPGELISCPDSDIPRAIDVIVERKPQRVALERLFAATSRGAALLTRLKADPALIDVEIRIVSHDSDYSRVSPRRPVVAVGHDVAHRRGRAGARTGSARHAPRAARHDDRDGRDPRRREPGAADRPVDRSARRCCRRPCSKPNQRVRVSMVDERVTLRMQATVAWARSRCPRAGPRRMYRAGLEFAGADADGIGGYLGTQAGTGLAGGQRTAPAGIGDGRQSEQVCPDESSRSRSEPVETMAAGTPVTSSRRAM